MITTRTIFRGGCYIAICVLLQFTALSQWSNGPTVNMSIVDTSRDQTSPRTIADGVGGAIFTWQDFRSGSSNAIYVQRVNATGNALWGSQGVAVASSSADQTSPSIISDGGGGAIISWQDLRNGNSDIFAQHISSGGVQLWPSSGVAICIAAGQQAQPAMVGDGSGGAILAWVDYRSGSANGDIFVQRITAAGVARWTADGIPICAAGGDQLNPRLVTDEIGGAIIAWEDNRGGPNSDIYAQRVDQNGNAKWTANGIRVSTASSYQQNPSIAIDDAHGAIIVWQDYRGGNWDIYAQHLGSDSTALWTSNGAAVCSTPGDQVLPVITLDGFGGAIMAWDDYRNADHDIYAQNLASGGTILWTHNGQAVCTFSGDQTFPAIFGDGLGGAIMTWQDARSSNADVYAQRMGTGGTGVWTQDGVAVSTATNEQSSPVITNDDANGAFIAWQDYRRGTDTTYNIYAQNVNSNGVLGLQTISGTVFSDLDSNGVLDAGEPGVQNWKISLSPSANVSKLTNTSGNYSFTGLLPGIYTITENDSNGKGWLLTSPGSLVITIDSAGDNPTGVNFGNFHLATIRGRVYRDVNANGIREVSDAGLPNWKIMLRGDATRDTTTNSIGDFIFRGLLPGRYTLREVLQAGWTQTQPSLPDSYGVVLTRGQQEVGRDFGNFQLGSISGKVCHDVNVDSTIVLQGLPDNGPDARTGGWTVKLYKGGIFLRSVTSVITGLTTGNYSFTGLYPGTYTVEESLQTGWAQTLPTPGGAVLTTFGVNAGPRAYQLTISQSNQNFTGRDFANFVLGTIEGRKFRDLTGDSSVTGDPPVAGWVIKLFKERAFQVATVTDDSGAYAFRSLGVGSYSVEESLKVGWAQTYPKPNRVTHDPEVVDTSYGINGGKVSRLVTIGSSGLDFPEQDFGNFRLASVAGIVFNDLDHNRLREVSEPGISLWKVKLKWKVKLTGKDTSLVTQTDANGNYAFVGLDSNKYVIQETLYVGWTRSLPAMADTYVVVLKKGQSVTGKDFGNYSCVSGQVLTDVNGDGVIGAGDPPAPNWKVSLKSLTTGTVRSATTDITGSYKFCDLPVGDVYTLSESLQVGWKQTFPTIVITGPPHLITGKNFGVFQLGKISGTKFNDLNGNGLRDSGDPLVPNWPISLSLLGQDSVLYTALTDLNGYYEIPDLNAGTYNLTEKTAIGNKQTTPGSASHAYALSISTSGEVQSGKDFGDFGWSMISGSVFHDLNGNGVKNGGESGLPKWRVYLASVLGSYRDTTLTADNGVYGFTGLPLGTYLISQERRSGWFQTSDSSVVVVTGQGQTLAGGNFGDFQASISGAVFNDLNGDGFLNVGKPSLSGWQVQLVDLVSGKTLQSALTDAGGRYSFQGVGPGMFSVSEQLQTGWYQTVPTAPGQHTLVISSSNTFLTDRNFGNFKLITVSGVSFEDVNANGIQNIGDALQPGWRVFLLKAGIPFDSAVTNGNGSYAFSSLKAGSYTISEELKSQWVRSGPVYPGSYMFSATSGSNLAAANFGNQQFRTNSILVRKFKDSDGNFGTHSDNSPKAWGVNLYKMTGGDDSLIASGVTRDTSSLLATDLPAGSYIARAADSTLWTSLGKIRDIIPIAGSFNADTLTLSAGDSHTIDFVGFLPNKVTVRSFADADAIFSSAADRSSAPWNLSIYANIVSGTPIATVASAESLVFASLGDGTFIATEADSSGWKHIGTILGGSGAAGSTNFRQFTISGGTTRVVDFVNSQIGTVVIRSFRDDDGDLATTSDRSVKQWNLKLYKDTVSTAKLVSNTTAESLFVSGAATGSYIAVEADTQKWSHVGTITDGVDSIGTHNIVAFTVLKGGTHVVEFVNAYPGRKRIWTAAVDCQWDNNTNWSPAIVPRSNDTIVISAASQFCLPEIPPNSIFAALIVDPGAQLRVVSAVETLNVNGDLTVNGIMGVEPPQSPTIVIGGNCYISGEFDPGHSTVVLPADARQTMTGGNFYNLQIGRAGSPSPPNILNADVRSSKNVVVDGILTLDQNFDMNDDTIFIRSVAPGSVIGQGSLTRGTMQRMVSAGGGLPYRFMGPAGSVLVKQGPAQPFEMAMTVYPETAASMFSQYWRLLGGSVDTGLARVIIDSITTIPPFTQWTFGVQQGDSSLPIVRRVYSIQSEIDTGLLAQVSLQYDHAEVPLGTDESSIVLLAKKFSSVMQSQAGWNSISLPVVAIDNRKKTLFPSGTSQAFRYDPVLHIYVPSDSIHNGMGYWLKFGASQKIDLQGQLRTRDTVTVYKGWNLIGSLSVPVPVQSVISSPVGNTKSSFFGYQQGYSAAKYLDPFKGYWIKAAQNGYLVMDASATENIPKESASLAAITRLEDLSKLMIADGGGAEQVLYFGRDGSLSPEFFELPPQFPSGGLDVRFASGSLVALASTTEPNEFPIRISSESNMISLSWEIRDLSESAALRIATKEIPLKGTGSIRVPNSGSAVVLRLSGLAALPKEFALEQNYPNPFNPVTVIRYQLPVIGHVTLKVYNVLGQEVVTLVDEIQDAGSKSIEWNGSAVASGVYFYRIEATSATNAAEKFTRTRKMLLLK